MTKPISPQEVVQLKSEQIPHGVIKAFNETIAAHYTAGKAEVPLQHVLDRIAIHMNTPEDAIPDWWLDVEDIYRQEGWKVTFYKPARDENFKSFFDFRKK